MANVSIKPILLLLLATAATVAIAPGKADDDSLNPKLPEKLSSEKFTELLNSGDDQDASVRAGIADRQGENGDQPLISIGSYGNQRFVDVVEVKPSGAPSYYLLDDDGDGNPSDETESFRLAPSVSKWRLGRW